MAYNKLPQILGFGLILDIIIVDQVSKWAIMELVLRPELSGGGLTFVDWILDAPLRMPFVSIPVIPSFNLTMVWNEGVSFGLFQNLGIWPLVVLSFAVSAVFAVWIGKSGSAVEASALGLVIGGAMGNVIDRFRFGAVADFFDVYVGEYHWPAFNVADAAITMGVAILVIHSLFWKKEDS